MELYQRGVRISRIVCICVYMYLCMRKFMHARGHECECKCKSVSKHVRIKRIRPQPHIRVFAYGMITQFQWLQRNTMSNMNWRWICDSWALISLHIIYGLTQLIFTGYAHRWSESGQNYMNVPLHNTRSVGQLLWQNVKWIRPHIYGEDERVSVHRGLDMG